MRDPSFTIDSLRWLSLVILFISGKYEPAQQIFGSQLNRFLVASYIDFGSHLKINHIAGFAQACLEKSLKIKFALKST